MTKRQREPNFKPFIEPTTVSNKQTHKVMQIHRKTTNYNQIRKKMKIILHRSNETDKKSLKETGNEINYKIQPNQNEKITKCNEQIRKRER